MDCRLIAAPPDGEDVDDECETGGVSIIEERKGLTFVYGCNGARDLQAAARAVQFIVRCTEYAPGSHSAPLASTDGSLWPDSTPHISAEES